MWKQACGASVAPVTYAKDPMLEWEGATNVGNVETSVWLQMPPVIYVGGWMLDDNESRRLHSQHICAVVVVVDVEAMVKTFWRCIHIHWVGM